LIVASRTARFGLPEVRRGLVAAGGGLVKLPRQAPTRLAMEMILTGDIYDAELLYQRGVINCLTEPDHALEVARKMASRIAENGPLAVAASKQIMQMSLDWPASEAFDRQKEFTAAIRESADAREGALAFAEKRKPQWCGS
jgi:enoyl-CoA hydratase